MERGSDQNEGNEESVLDSNMTSDIADERDVMVDSRKDDTDAEKGYDMPAAGTYNHDTKDGIVSHPKGDKNSDMMADRGAKIDSDKVDTNKENRVGMTGTEKELIAVSVVSANPDVTTKSGNEPIGKERRLQEIWQSWFIKNQKEHGQYGLYQKQDMKGFRLKLAATLISSFLNVRRGRPLFLRNDDGPGNPNNVVEIDDPKQRTTTPSNGKHERREDMIGILCDYFASIDDVVVLEKYGETITHFYKKYTAAMNVNSSRWDQNIYKWSFTHEKEIIEDEEKCNMSDRKAGGYLVLQYMSWWKSIRDLYGEYTAL
ncbi:hypothetical protein C2845_PM06G25700 [Panicum miliaceum]|uniref:Uncharacterized protein n=1 Tax=Panicum miliaceum TaxID=4540 RepID=A0A3L6REI6_PANMI|nr:hypothetical protein C2845_PM06G25700 [Panicum miliaceum]